MTSIPHAFPGWMKRSGIVFLLLLSCSHVQPRLEFSPDDACALLDSLYAAALLPAPYTLRGKARFDVNQYRLRGTFTLNVYPEGDTSTAGAAVPADLSGSGGSTNRPAMQVFDFVSSSYFGSHREDISISMTDGAIWVLDRERGEFYEGENANRFIRERLDISGDFSEVIGLATGSGPACSALHQPVAHTTSQGDISIRGLVGGERAGFLFDASGGKLKEIIWPFEVQPGTIEELRITYEWSEGGKSLEGILLILESLNWQIKLGITDVAQ